jgi:hypothetical protein
MKLFFLHILTASLLLSTPAFSQVSKHNIELGIGASKGYNFLSATKTGWSGDVGHIVMLSLSNAITLNANFTSFRTGSASGFRYRNEFRTLTAGLRHRFSEIVYTSISIGGASILKSSGSETFAGIAQIRSGVLLPLKSNSIDISILLNQATDKTGWLGIRIGTVLPVNKRRTLAKK